MQVPGRFQLCSKDLGLLLSVNCYHGLKLNETNEEASFGWNGKKDALCLCGVKNEEQEMKVVYICVACNNKWSTSVEAIQTMIVSQEMKLRLFNLCSVYWEEKNPGKIYPHIMNRIKNDTQTVSLGRTSNKYGDNYAVSWYDTEGSGGTTFFKDLDKAFEYYLNK